MEFMGFTEKDIERFWNAQRNAFVFNHKEYIKHTGREEVVEPDTKKALVYFWMCEHGYKLTVEKYGIEEAYRRATIPPEKRQYMEVDGDEIRLTDANGNLIRKVNHSDRCPGFESRDDEGEEWKK